MEAIDLDTEPPKSAFLRYFFLAGQPPSSLGIPGHELRTEDTLTLQALLNTDRKNRISEKLGEIFAASPLSRGRRTEEDN